MIAPQRVDEIRRLLAEKTLSQRKIARRTGVSRGTVGAIASGRRPNYEGLRKPCDDGWEPPSGPPARCPGCGGMVRMPCLLCRIREMIAENPRLKLECSASQVERSLRLNLRPEHRAHYEEIRDWRWAGRAYPLKG